MPLLLTSPDDRAGAAELGAGIDGHGPVPVPLPVVFVTTSVPPLIVVPPV